MLQNERQEQIIALLEDKKTVRIGELSKILNVTRETVRRDLYEMEKQGLLKKVHGGAMLNKTVDEPHISQRQVSNITEKERIAKKAAEYVEDGDAVFIDLGSTTLMLAKCLRNKNNITVITNSLPVAVEMSEHPHAKVILCGGELRSGELSLSGPVALKSLEDFYIDKAFIGVGGISPDNGFTDYHVGDAEVRRLMMRRAKETFALADYSKFRITAFMKVCSLNEVDMVITDSTISEQEIRQYHDLGLQIITT